MGVTLTPHPLVPWSRKSRAIPLLPHGSYGLYRASVHVQGYTLPYRHGVLVIGKTQNSSDNADFIDTVRHALHVCDSQLLCDVSKCLPFGITYT
jgi:hypothetical protein